MPRSTRALGRHRRSRFVGAIFAATLLSGVGACRAETDSSHYVAGEPGVATFRNGTTESLFLEGCSAFHFEQSVEGEWLERGPSVVCVWEGYAREVAPGVSTDDPFQAPRTTGVWRLRYAVGYGCQSGLPLGQAGCERMATTTTLPFTVERALCDPSEQGCQIWPAAPNHLCPDGVNMGGPNAECTRDPATGQCGYEFLVCP